MDEGLQRWKKRIHFKSKGNLKIIRQDLQDRQDIRQRQHPVNPVNPVKIPCFLKWIRKNLIIKKDKYIFGNNLLIRSS
jgi:hypothetical protein